MKNVLLFLVPILLAGCGTTSFVRLDIPAADHVAFRFEDDRPPEERKSRVDETSFSVTRFYGDENLSPAAPEIFRSYLAENLGKVLAGKDVKLTTFLVSASDPRVSIDGQGFNNAAHSAPNANPAGVVLAAPLILGIESIKSQKLVSVSIHGSVNDREFSKECSGTFRGRATESNVREVVLDCLKEFAGVIETAGIQ